MGQVHLKGPLDITAQEPHVKAQFSSLPTEKRSSLEKASPKADIYRNSKKENVMETILRSGPRPPPSLQATLPTPRICPGEEGTRISSWSLQLHAACWVSEGPTVITVGPHRILEKLAEQVQKQRLRKQKACPWPRGHIRGGQSSNPGLPAPLAISQLGPGHRLQSSSITS